jgi:hypothetical protein
MHLVCLYDESDAVNNFNYVEMLTHIQHQFQLYPAQRMTPTLGTDLPRGLPTGMNGIQLADDI